MPDGGGRLAGKCSGFLMLSGTTQSYVPDKFPCSPQHNEDPFVHGCPQLINGFPCLVPTIPHRNFCNY